MEASPRERERERERAREREREKEREITTNECEGSHHRDSGDERP